MASWLALVGSDMLESSNYGAPGYIAMDHDGALASIIVLACGRAPTMATSNANVAELSLSNANVDL